MLGPGCPPLQQCHAAAVDGRLLRSVGSDAECPSIGTYDVLI